MRKITEILGCPIWQLTGEEYVALHRYAHEHEGMNSKEHHPIIRVTGVRALSEHCSCSESQIYKLLREGVLEAAIISRVGKSIVFNGEVALRCAADYQELQRMGRKQKNDE